MSNSVYVAVGVAPEGSVVTEWEKYYDDHGYRHEYSFEMVPSEVVTTLFQDRKDNVLNGEEDFGTVREFAALLVETVAAGIVLEEGQMIVAQTTTSVKQGWSFVATTWMPLQEALDILTEN